jgi:hypothetical protein
MHEGLKGNTWYNVTLQKAYNICIRSYPSVSKCAERTNANRIPVSHPDAEKQPKKKKKKTEQMCNRVTS